MATELRLRRDDTSHLLAMTPALSEAMHNTETFRLHIGDGSTPGGRPVALLADVENSRRYIFETRGAALSAKIPPSVTNLRLQGYFAVNDGGRSDYTKVLTEPSHPGKLQTDDGAWWEIAEDSFQITMFGARKGDVNTYAADNKIAIQAALTTANAQKIEDVIIPSGVFVSSAAIYLNKAFRVTLRGRGPGSVLKGGSGFSGEIITYGDTLTGGGILSRILDMTIGGVLSGTCNGISCIGANTGIVHGVQFRGTVNSMILDGTYALKVSKCHFHVPTNNAIRSLTSCHNLTIDTCWFWTSGGAALSINGPVNSVCNNIVIINSDLEYCASIIQTSIEVRSLVFVGNYVEGTVNREFSFAVPVYGFTCDNNVIELRGAVPGSGVGSGVVSSYDNIKGGSFRYNVQFEQKIAFSGTCEGVTVVSGPLTGNSSLTGVPYKDPGTLLNNWTKTDNTTYPVGYARDGDGTVHVKGQLTAGSGSTGNPVFVLPVGYRPASRLVVACVGPSGSVNVIVDVNGNVVPSTASGVWLDSIRFPAAPVPLP